MIYVVHRTGATRIGKYMDVAMFENTYTGMHPSMAMGSAMVIGKCRRPTTKMPALPKLGQLHTGALITPANGSGGRELPPVS